MPSPSSNVPRRIDDRIHDEAAGHVVDRVTVLLVQIERVKQRIGCVESLAVDAVIQSMRPGVARRELNTVAHAVVGLYHQRLIVADYTADNVSHGAKVSIGPWLDRRRRNTERFEQRRCVGVDRERASGRNLVSKGTAARSNVSVNKIRQLAAIAAQVA